MSRDGPLALVTGATGAVGPVLVRRLSAEGWRVRALARHPPPAGVLPSGVQFLALDVSDRKALLAAAEGVQAVFHLAAKLHVYSPSAEAIPEYRRVNIEGTRAAAEAARRADVPRFVLLSTANVYGPSHSGQVHTEEAPLRPSGPYEQTKVEAEMLVRDLPGATVLRPAAVYGPGMKGNYLRLAMAVARGRFLPIGSGSNCRTLIYEEDLARACLLAATHPRSPGRTYNVTDGGLPSFNEIVAAIARAAGRGPPRLRVPLAPVRWSVGFIEGTFRIVGRAPPLTRAALDKLTEDMAVDGQRLRSEIGFERSYDLDRGWAATLRAWRLGPMDREAPHAPSRREGT